jgi:hypothetical protein
MTTICFFSHSHFLYWYLLVATRTIVSILIQELPWQLLPSAAHTISPVACRGFYDLIPPCVHFGLIIEVGEANSNANCVGIGIDDSFFSQCVAGGPLSSQNWITHSMMLLWT